MSFERTIVATQRFAPPGHYYSPHPRLEDVEARQAASHHKTQAVAGVNLNLAEQLDLLKRVDLFQSVGPWTAQLSATYRFFYDNHFFRFGDGNAVWQITQLYRPKQVIEVGSGFSTACWLDTIDALNLETKLTCIEPYTERVRQLCRPDDFGRRISLLETPVQDVPVDAFKNLTAGDVLFIDSTHVSKSGSDVNYLFFQVLPNLAAGVIVHIHDIFWPFDYPLSWYQEGRAWNECFLLRAFLQFNTEYRIIRFNSYLAQQHSTEFERLDGRFVSDAGGSIWLCKNSGASF